MKTQEDYPAAISHVKERLEDYATSVAKIKSDNKSRVLFQSFFTTTFLQHDSLLVFSFLPCFCTF